MFDLDISKMIIVGIVALAVIPPKDLPRVMRTVGQTLGRMRRMAAEFQGQFMEAMREVEREADLESVKKEFQAINDQAKVNASFDPVGMVRDDITKAAATSTTPPQIESSAQPQPQREIAAPEVALAASEPAAATAELSVEKDSTHEAPAAQKSAAE
jgi:sec-independent protein translocase protein TatB